MDIIVFIVCEYCGFIQLFTGQNKCNLCNRHFTTKALTKLLFSRNEYVEDQ